jgi:alpha-ribazole phosphatase
MDDAVVVALFRHGITEENKRKAYLGWRDEPICDEARKSLEKTDFELSSYEYIITSDLLRCRETAHLLFSNQSKVSFSEFREIHFGLWEGKTYSELAGDPYYEEWLKMPFDAPIPEGENYSRFADRIQNGWKKMLDLMVKEKVSRIAIVTHGGVIRFLLSRFDKRKREFWEWQVPHGYGFELIWNSKEAFRRGEACTLLREVPLTENPTG